MDAKEYESLQRRLQELKDFKADHMAQMRTYQEQLKSLRDKSLSEYGVPLEELGAHAQKEEQRYNQEMETFRLELQEAEKIRQEIETNLAAIDG